MAQCFPCYDSAMFQYHGMTDSYNPRQLAIEYAVKAAEEDVINCDTCGRKVRYIKTGEEKWTEEVVEANI